MAETPRTQSQLQGGGKALCVSGLGVSPILWAQGRCRGSTLPPIFHTLQMQTQRAESDAAF